MRRIVDQWALLLFLSVMLGLTACSGNNDGSTTTATDDEDGDSTSYIIELSSDSTELPSGEETIAITVTVKDANNVPTPNVETRVTVTDADGAANANNLTVDSATTDENGQITATLGTSDATPRTVTLTAAAGATTNTLALTVSTNSPTLELFSSSSQLLSNIDGDNTISLFALVRDSNNVVIAGETVEFSSDDGSLSAGSAVTDDMGRASVELSTRTVALQDVTVTSTFGSLTDTVTVPITNTTLSAATNTSSIALGGSVAINIALVDAAGAGVVSEALTVTSASGNTLGTDNVTFADSPLTVQTDNSGLAIVYLRGDQLGTDTVTVSGLSDGSANTVSETVSVGVTNESFSLVQASPANSGSIKLSDTGSVTLTWQDQNGTAQAGQTVTFSITRGNFIIGATTPTVADYTTDANGQVTAVIESNDNGPAEVTATAANGTTTTLTVNFIADNPEFVSLVASPRSIGPGEQSTITALLRDASGNIVAEYPTTFQLTDISGGGISVANTNSNENGVATTVYTASQISPADGVTITGSFIPLGGTEADAISDSVTITVGDKPVIIGGGRGSDIDTATSAEKYSINYTVFVTDAGGVGQEGVELSATIRPFNEPGATINNNNFAYIKGIWTREDSNGNREDFDTGFSLDDFERWVLEPTTAVYCGSEDNSDNGTDNGILDEESDGETEDLNGDGRLTPGAIASVEKPEPTDANGFSTVTVTYARTNAAWAAATLKVTASSINGSEALYQDTFVLPIPVDEVTEVNVEPVAQGSSPFGVNACTDPD